MHTLVKKSTVAKKTHHTKQNQCSSQQITWGCSMSRFCDSRVSEHVNQCRLQAPPRPSLLTLGPCRLSKTSRSSLLPLVRRSSKVPWESSQSLTTQKSCGCLQYNSHVCFLSLNVELHSSYLTTDTAAEAMPLTYTQPPSFPYGLPASWTFPCPCVSRTLVEFFCDLSYRYKAEARKRRTVTGPAGPDIPPPLYFPWKELKK